MTETNINIKVPTGAKREIEQELLDLLYDGFIRKNGRFVQAGDVG